ncbi:MAG: site-specific integrase, partial [Culicoidibacterales bacterium]
TYSFQRGFTGNQLWNISHQRNCVMTKTPPINVELALQKLLEAMHQSNFSKKHISNQHAIYNRFKKFVLTKKILKSPVNLNVITKFLNDCGIPSLDFYTPNHSYERRVQLAMKRLLFFVNHGKLTRLHTAHTPVPPAEFLDIYNQYFEFRIEEKSLAPSTMRLSTREICRFLNYLHEIRVPTLQKIMPIHVDMYFKRSSTLAPTSVASKAYNIREFFRFLILHDIIKAKMLTAIPNVRYIRRTRLIDVWPDDSVTLLLKHIDRHSPIGKRDYAICILAARLGLRTGDIRTLMLENIDWKNATITICQQKTDKIVALPFTEEVGSAIIDYLKNSRPQTDHRHVFITHNAPFTPFGHSFYHIIDKYRRKAKITLPNECRKGLHSLRHTIATRLHEAEVPISVIATFLGHHSVESTRHYAKANIELLRKAALDWEENVNE